MPASTFIRPFINGPIHYRDKLIKLLGVFTITFFAYYLTYNGSDSWGWFVYEILSDAFKIWITWEVVKCCIRFLDHRLPWSVSPAKRLIAQIALSLPIGISFLIAMVWLDFRLIRTYKMDHLSFDMVIALIFILLVNSIYIILYYHQSLQQTKLELENEKNRQQLASEIKNGGLIVRLGKKEIRIPFSEITCYYARNKNTQVITQEGRHFPVEMSLDQLQKAGYGDGMFRANRQYLLTNEIIQSTQSEPGGKIIVNLKEGSGKETSIVVSREKAAAFRQWFKPV